MGTQSQSGRFILRTSLAVLMAGTASLTMLSLTARAQTAPTAVEGVKTDLDVKYDQSQLIELPRPAAEIIVGNPIIADVSAHSGTTLIVTGRTFGVTNLIVLDAERKRIAEHRVIVSRDDVRSINLFRGTKRQSYNCIGNQACNPSLVIGDDPAYFKSVQETAKTKLGFSASGVESGFAGSGAGGAGGPGGPGGGGDGPPQ